jgi:hypothetical protein
MGLQQFERRLERLVEGVFARAFRSGLQPVEIGHRLAREMDLRRQMAPRGMLAPNRFLVSLSPEDRARFDPIEDELVAELVSVAKDHAYNEDYHFVGRVDVDLETDDDLSPGMLLVTGEMVANQPAPDHRQSPASDFDDGVEQGRSASRGRGEPGRDASSSAARPPAAPPPPPAPPAGPAGPNPAGARPRPARVGAPPPPPPSRRERTHHPEPAGHEPDPTRPAPQGSVDATLMLPDGRRLVLGARGLVIGRQPDCDLVLADPNVSRHHAEIRPAGDGEFEVADLGSTNGTKLNGARVQGIESLRDGDSLIVGATTLRFEQG